MEINKRNPKNYWTYEKCLEVALKCSIRNVFKDSYNSAYNSARKNNWLDEICSHMNGGNKHSGYWTYEKCKLEALKFESKIEFKNNCESAYKKACENKWIDEICSHMIPIGNLYKRLIYVYEFSDNSVYIGLTFNLDKRNCGHKIKGIVHNYMKKTNLIPSVNKLTEYIDVKDAQKLEKFYIEKYKSEGFTILNTAKAGALGSGFRKWTFENCELESKKYKSRSEFSDNNYSAYNRSRINKWLDIFYPLKNK